MNEFLRRIAGLSPEKRALYMQLLAEEGLDLALLDEAARPAAPENAGTPPAGKPRPMPRPEQIPLSFAQQRLWFLDQLTPGNPFYNKTIVAPLNVPVDHQGLKWSVEQIVRRHEALRTLFPSEDGQPIQRIQPPGALELPLIDLTDHPQEARTRQAYQLAQSQAVMPFDLARGPLLRATLLKLEAQSYLLLLTMHHIICDGWSLGLFFQELTSHYEAYSRGRQASPLPDLPLQYGDYALWQRQWLEGPALEPLLRYWLDRLSGLRTLELPTDRPRPPVQSFAGDVVEWHFPGELAARLRELSRRENVTLFMLLLSAYYVVLQRYSRQDDLVVGTYVANRNHTELEGLIGFFVNTLVLRASLAGDPTLREVLQRVRQATLAAYEHDDMPFERLVEALQPVRDLSRNPLFQVILQLETVNAHSQAPQNQQTWNIAGGTSAFDLAMNLLSVGDTLTAKIEYSTELFEEETIRRLARHYEQILQSMVATPELRLSSVDCLAPDERTALLAGWNATACEVPAARLEALVAAQAARTPAQTAVVGVGSTLSYQELNAQANRLAHLLRQEGVRAETPVGVLLPRSPGLVVALLAVLKAGGAYVPLDPAFPPARLAMMLYDAGIRLLITSKEAPALPVDAGRRHLYMEEMGELLDGSTLDPAPAAGTEGLAYIIYTSGSTGRPKGVEIPHRAVVNFLMAMAERPGFSPQDTLLSVTTISFDIAVLELFLPLVTGGTVVIATAEQARDGIALAQLLAKTGATVMQATPATWRLLLESGWRGDGRLKILCGGEALPASLARRLGEAGTSVWNMYGPTETTVWSSTRALLPAADTVLLGGPLANTQFYILDRHLRLAPMGVPGELFIGGDGLAHGYHRRPGLTAERFIPDPFSRRPGARLYRTGDIVRYRGPDALEFLGRDDHQMKIRGFRIEPGEVEAALRAQPEVRDAVVMAQGDSQGEKWLVAYLVPEGQPGPDAAELRQSLQAFLPHYMIPNRFVSLPALPLTPNGKIDRRQLSLPEDYQPEMKNTYVAPGDATEQRLAAIWADVLDVRQVGAHDNFFELGGHSLLAAQLVARIARAFDVSLALRTLFEAPTVAQLALALRAAAGGRGDSEEELPPDADGAGRPPAAALPRIKRQARPQDQKE
jgi:amino acid adenylation domain-containing protein